MIVVAVATALIVALVDEAVVGRIKIT